MPEVAGIESFPAGNSIQNEIALLYAGMTMLRYDDKEVIDSWAEDELVHFDRIVNTMIRGEKRIFIAAEISLDSLVLRRPRHLKRIDWKKMLVEIPNEDYTSSNWIECRLTRHSATTLELKFIRISYRARVRIRRLIEEQVHFDRSTLSEATSSVGWLGNEVTVPYSAESRRRRDSSDQFRRIGAAS